jgi:hypothetical protein
MMRFVELMVLLMGSLATTSNGQALPNGKSMTVQVKPGQSENIHLLLQPATSGQSKLSFEIVKQPTVGKITALGKFIGVASYQASSSDWKQDSFEFVVKNESGESSGPATITIMPQKSDRQGSLIAENISGKFAGPTSINNETSAFHKLIFKEMPTEIKLRATSSLAGNSNLSFKILKQPQFGTIFKFDDKKGEVVYKRSTFSDQSDSFTYSVVDELDGSHSQPGTVSLTVYSVEGLKSYIKSLPSGVKSMLGFGG